MNSRALANVIAVIAAAFALVCLHPLSAFAQDDAARAEAIAQADKQMKQLLHGVQLAVERYSVDYGACPVNIQVLMDEGYLSDPPANPYFGLDDRAPEKLLEEELKLRATPGAVVYHPYSLNGSTLDGYILLAAGTKESGANGLHAHDLFYGEPRWDSLHFFTEDGKGDGRWEHYILLLARPSLSPENVFVVARGANLAPPDLKQDVRDAAHAVQLAVERYGVDNDGIYPPDLQTLVDEGYVYWPLNPYFGAVPDAPVRVPFCSPGEFVPGGIVYQPIAMPDRFGNALVAYNLGVFGDDPDGGMDAGAFVDGEWRFYYGVPASPDGVTDGFILVLESGPAPEDCPGGV